MVRLPSLSFTGKNSSYSSGRKEEGTLRNDNFISQSARVSFRDLEAKANSELSLEGYSNWLGETRCAKEVEGLAEVR